MHVHLDKRQDPHDCTPGKRYYQCAVNSFTGCCGVDPCSLSGCRDNSTVATSNSGTYSLRSNQSTRRRNRYVHRAYQGLKVA
jgi:hypothetical protein